MEYFVNGRRAALDPGDRGLAYGDGLFETMAARAGSIRWLNYHLQRLESGCRRLAMPVPDLKTLRDELTAQCPSASKAVVKLIVTRGAGARGYGLPEPAKPTRIVSIGPWSGYPREHYTRGVALALCTLRLAENPQLAGLKHLCRLEQILAQMELTDRKVDEGLLRNRSGAIVGGISSNVFCIRGGVLVTPPLRTCGVHGVMRRVVLEQAEAIGLEARLQELTLSELIDSDEVFITNALAGVRPVRKIANHELPVGKHTRAFIEHLECANND